MASLHRHLHVVRSRAEDEALSSELEDVGLTLMIFLVAALPVGSAIGGIGRWDEASLGLGALGVLLAGRELLAWLLARRRSGRRP